MAQRGLPWRVEEACLNAFPSLKQVLLGGWLLRFADGLSLRANSVNPLGAACERIDGAIAAAESLYHRQRLPTIFRVPSLAAPALDLRLADRFYTREGESCVLYGPITAVTAAAGPQLELSPRPSAEWLAAMAALQRHSAAQRRVYRRIVRAIAVPTGFAGLRTRGRLVALAYGAIHDGLLRYESVVTDPAHRRQGLARAVVAGLAAWGRGEGAVGACLQVEAKNAPARSLYKGCGLGTELYRYHYHREPPREGRGDGPTGY